MKHQRHLSPSYVALEEVSRTCALIDDINRALRVLDCDIVTEEEGRGCLTPSITPSSQSVLNDKQKDRPKAISDQGPAPPLLRLPEVPAEKFYGHQRADEQGSQQGVSADGRSRQSPFVVSRVTQQKSDHERRNAGTNYKTDLPNVHSKPQRARNCFFALLRVEPTVNNIAKTPIGIGPFLASAFPNACPCDRD
jgi:hypothetical protein